jgi:hypothetical protein
MKYTPYTKIMPKTQQVNPTRLSSLFIIVLCLMFAAVIATTLGFVLGLNNDPREVLGNMDMRILSN